MKKLFLLLLAPVLFACDKDDFSEYYDFPALTRTQQDQYIERLKGVWQMQGPISTDGLYYYVIDPATGISMESSKLVDNILLYTERKWDLSAKQLPSGELIKITFDTAPYDQAFYFTFTGKESIRVEHFVDKKIRTLGYLTPKNDVTLLNASEVNRPLVGIWEEVDIEDGRPVSYLVFKDGFLHSRYTFNGDLEFTDAPYRFDNHIEREDKSADGYSYQAIISIPGDAIRMRVYTQNLDRLWYESWYTLPKTRESPIDEKEYGTYGWQQFRRIDKLPDFN